MKPPFSYFGGKQTLAARLVQILPVRRVYIEPFFGSGAVFFAKPRGDHEIINDRDGEIVNFFRVLRDSPEELQIACHLSPYARDEWSACADLPEGITPIERARRFWVRISQSFGAKTIDTGWSRSVSRTPQAATIARRLGMFAGFAERLSRVTIENYNAVDLIDRMACKDSVIYADPPYVHKTRIGISKRPRGDYAYEMTDQDHRRLAESLRATPAAVVLSGYDSGLYRELYGDWQRIDVDVVTSVGSRPGSKLQTRTECIYLNRQSQIEQLPLIC